MHFHFWNWFFQSFVHQAPSLPNLGRFKMLEPTRFRFEPSGRFAASLEKALQQRTPPPSIPHRWAGPRNLSSIIKWSAFIQAGGSLSDATPFQLWVHTYQKHSNTPIVDTAKTVQQALLFFGDSLPKVALFRGGHATS